MRAKGKRERDAISADPNSAEKLKAPCLSKNTVLGKLPSYGEDEEGRMKDSRLRYLYI